MESAKETNAIDFFFSYWNTDTEHIKISDAKNISSFSNIFFIFLIKHRKKRFVILRHDKELRLDWVVRIKDNYLSSLE